MNNLMFDFNKTQTANSVVHDYNMDGMAEQIKDKIMSDIMTNKQGFLLVDTTISGDQITHIQNYCNNVGKKLFIIDLDHPDQIDFGINPFIGYAQNDIKEIHEQAILKWNTEDSSKLSALNKSGFAVALNCTDPEQNITLQQLIEQGHVMIVHGSNSEEAKNFSYILSFWLSDLDKKQVPVHAKVMSNILTGVPMDKVQVYNKFHVIGDSSFPYFDLLTSISMPTNGMPKPKNVFGLFIEKRTDITVFRDVVELQIKADIIFSADKKFIQGGDGTQLMNIVLASDKEGVYPTGIEKQVEAQEKYNGYLKCVLSDGTSHILNIQDANLNSPDHDLSSNIGLVKFAQTIIVNGIDTTRMFDGIYVYAKIAAFQSFAAFLSHMVTISLHYTDKDENDHEIDIPKADFDLLKQPNEKGFTPHEPSLTIPLD